MNPFIQINNLHFSYHYGSGVEIIALNGLDLVIQEGEFIAILGANGSGKSTLARHFNGLLKPTIGDVFVRGKNTRDPYNLRDIRRTVAMVFQHPESQAVATTVEEDVAFGLENLGVPSSEIRRRVDWALDAVDLSGLNKRAPHHLSGGQKQRLALAGVLAMEPSCIVLDEATSMLDPSGRRGLRDILQRLHTQGVTIVMITQDMDEAVMSERVVILSKGLICRDDESRKVLTDETFLQSVGLDLPSVTRIAYALHAQHHEFPVNLLTISEIIGQIGRQYSSVTPKKDHGFKGHMNIYSPQNIDDVPKQEMGENLTQDGFIKAYNLKYTYMRGTPLETEALRGVNYTVHTGKVYGLIGATGSGKSTLLQHLNGLLPVQSGELRIGNIIVTKNYTNFRDIRQQVALLFQQPEDQLFERYIADDVAYGPINLRLPLTEVRQRVERAMEAVGLPLVIFRDRSIYSLSGGERRRAALAGVLALEPKVLLLDEASAGLDPQGRRELRGLLSTWQTKGDRAIVWASHSMDEISQIADRVTVMAAGQVKLDGFTQHIFSQAEILTLCGLEVPQVTQIMMGIAHMGIDVPMDILTYEKTVLELSELLA
jgi:energy-coupling factor transporter ATPase